MAEGPDRSRASGAGAVGSGIARGRTGARGSGDRRARATDFVAAVVVRGAALTVAAGFLWLVGDVVRNGLGVLGPGYLTGPVLDAGRAGGLGPVLVSTALILGVSLAAAVPVGLGAAVFLSEAAAGSRAGGAVRRSLDLLAGVPSIVFGLFGAVFFGEILGMGFSILAGGLTLALMVLPILVRTTEAGLRAVPRELRLGAAALSLSRTTTLVRLLLPRATPALAAGFVLGVGRALAETAALLFTAGYVTRMPGSLLDSGRSLSVHVYDLASNVAGGTPRAYGAALVLLLVLAATNLAATGLARRYGRSGGVAA